MKNTEQYLKKLLKKNINETLEEKVDMLMDKIKKSEMEEGKDDFSIDIEYDPDSFSEIKSIGSKRKLMKEPIDSVTPDEYNFRKSMEDLEDDDINFDYPYEDDDIEPISEGEMCEQCGSGSISEGECNECGYKRMNEGLYDVDDIDNKNEFDYVAEDDIDKILGCKPGEINYDPIVCQDRKEMMMKELNEKLHGKQKKLDKNKNNKIDAEDFKLLRKSKKEVTEKYKSDVEEGNEFTGELAKARKEGKKEFEVDGKSYPVKESIEYHIKDIKGDIIKLNENELIDLIENIVNEETKSGLKTIGKPKGLTTYEKAHKGSGKENQEYFKSFEKKMKDYLKDGSKGKFDMNPKMFPQGNGELGKMDKKAFKMTDNLEDFNYEIAGQNFPTPDAIDYNEEWMEKLFKGNSMTGNAPGGNALESKTNDRFNKMRKKNTLKKLKDQSYKRVSQPIYNEKTGVESGKGLNIKLENVDSKEEKVLNEEFDRIKELLNYNRKTQ